MQQIKCGVQVWTDECCAQSALSSEKWKWKWPLFVTCTEIRAKFHAFPVHAHTTQHNTTWGDRTAGLGIQSRAAERRSNATHARRRFCYIFGSVCCGSAWARNPLLLSCSFNPEGGAHYVSRVPLPLFIPLPPLADRITVYSRQPMRRERKVCNREKPQDGCTCDSTVTDGCICPCGLCVGWRA